MWLNDPSQKSSVETEVELHASSASYLPTIPEFLGESRKLTSRPTVPEAFKNVPENIHVASVYTKYTSDHDSLMLVGQDQCQAQNGCQWVRSSEPLPKEWASKWQPWWSGNCYSIILTWLTISLRVSKFFPRSIAMPHCPAKASKILQKWVRLSCIYKSRVGKYDASMFFSEGCIRLHSLKSASVIPVMIESQILSDAARHSAGVGVKC